MAGSPATRHTAWGTVMSPWEQEEVEVTCPEHPAAQVLCVQGWQAPSHRLPFLLMSCPCHRSHAERGKEARPSPEQEGKNLTDSKCSGDCGDPGSSGWWWSGIVGEKRDEVTTGAVKLTRLGKPIPDGCQGPPSTTVPPGRTRAASGALVGALKLQSSRF